MSKADEIKAQMAQLQQKLNQLENLPMPLENPDFRQLKKYAISHINCLANNGIVDEDDKQYIFEEALKAVYGKDIFIWYNKV
jgi:hypothetical protein